VLVLMSFCVLGITGLQLYWNYQNYKTVVANFKKDANNALVVAVDREMMQRRGELVTLVKTWLADTSFINIECNIENRDSSTVFTIQDVHPRYEEDKNRKAKSYSFGIGYFKKKLKKITPEAKKLFINHFAERTFKGDLENGTIYYYTQGLGDSISKAFEKSEFNKTRFADFYKNELTKREINSSFKINSLVQNTDQFITKKINTSLRRPYNKEMIFASLENPNQYYLREMKWLIIGSVLLIGITIFCFYYTIKTLLNQTKLVAIKNQFISNMTHEINTPLASIQVTTEALQQFDPEPATRKKYLDIILYQTKKLNDLSNEILENAKLETLDFSMEESVDLAVLIKNVINELDNHNSIETNFDESDFLVSGNRIHLTRSIANILENAIKYNTADSPKIKIKLAKSNSNILLNIEDNGPGIADEFKTKIFEQFYRIPTGNMHNIKGYGLGLSYVKKVIAQHKGSVSVSDNQPYGTIFSINLPS
ncbi:MAG: HAMP domain-containing histidine kinase, partial [Pedobacter sp.]